MKYSLEKIKLGSVLTKSSLLETPVPFQTYKQLGVQLWGKGTYSREEIDGRNTGYKFFNKLKAGDFVVNKIWARNGAASVVPREFDGYYVSTEYPVFHIDQSVLSPEWMLYVTQQKWFWDACNDQSFGTSGKNRIRPEKILEIEIPLPTLIEQRRIVSEIESIKDRLEQIKKIRLEQSQEIKNLLYSKYIDLIGTADWISMNEVAPIIRREVDLIEDRLYPELGIKCFGKGTFHKPALSGFEIGTKKIFRIEKGDLVFSNVFAWEGGIAVAKEEDDNRFGSHRFISCLVDTQKALPDFLCYHFLSPKGLEDINACSPGGAGRNKTLGLNKLMQIKVPIPDISLQEEFITLLHNINTIRDQHSQTETEMTQLIPSLLNKAFKGDF